MQTFFYFFDIVKCIACLMQADKSVSKLLISYILSLFDAQCNIVILVLIRMIFRHSCFRFYIIIIYIRIFFLLSSL